MNRERWIARSLRIAIEGPRRPWWLSPLMIVAPASLAKVDSVLGLGVVRLAPRIFGLIGLACTLLGVLWFAARMAQYSYYKRLASTSHAGRCPMCRYDMTALTSGICPECGTHVAEYLRRVRRATGVNPPPRPE